MSPRPSTRSRPTQNGVDVCHGRPSLPGDSRGLGFDSRDPCQHSSDFCQGWWVQIRKVEVSHKGLGGWGLVGTRQGGWTSSTDTRPMTPTPKAFSGSAMKALYLRGAPGPQRRPTSGSGPPSQGRVFANRASKGSCYLLTPYCSLFPSTVLEFSGVYKVRTGVRPGSGRRPAREDAEGGRGRSGRVDMIE